MKKQLLLIVTLWSILLTACQNTSKEPKSTIEPEDTDPIIVDADQYLLMETSEGNVTFKLYRETPLHRHNFVKLARKGYYDNQQFFRIQNNFTIQAGDPKSKGATRETPLGENDLDYFIPEEIQPEKFYHKRGALAMASYYKMEKSSGGHFYVVTGMKYTDKKLFNAEDAYNKRLRKEVFDSITQTAPYAQKLKEYAKDTKRYMPQIREIKSQISAATDKVMATRKQFHYTKQQSEQYKTIGGAADLDGYYTVFGEVIEGMDVITKIEKRAVDSKLRPIEAVIIKRIREIDAPQD
ncbi:MAG: peptidylprolyl isomerase [Bacteroidaceae bacterium]|nr:peptidylprolyl isomerase [Bacteroidaceae bacterium]